MGGYAFVRVENGTVLYHVASRGWQDDVDVVESLTSMMAEFAHHLPDMQIAVNLDNLPEVLAPASEMARLRKRGKQLRGGRLSGRATVPDTTNEAGGAQLGDQVQSLIERQQAKSNLDYVSFHEAMGAACGSKTAWHSNGGNVRDFCSACANPQSVGQFVLDEEKSMDICHQPDIMHLHSFPMADRGVTAWKTLMPVFSRSKSSSFGDILIPLPYPANIQQEQDTGAMFVGKKDALYWRGRYDHIVPDHEHMHGGQQARLAHVINNASATEEVVMLLPTASNEDRFSYERVKAKDISSVLPFDVGINDFGECERRQSKCGPVQQEFGSKPSSRPLENRYVLCLDDRDGPTSDTLPTLRSTSIPFIATIFREWYTERLLPWLHYVPIDLRYHGLHSTLAYFAGLDDRGAVNGRDIVMIGKMQDAEWIAEQGKRWADKALRREDMQIYLFRLLLEWGRIIDDRRDELGFVLEQT
jgi:hypothetical protein